MSEMVERVARAISHADEQNGGPPYDYRISLGKHAKAQLFDQARAAIEAMRDIGPLADDYGALDGAYPDADEVRELFANLIDAALKP